MKLKLVSHQINKISKKDLFICVLWWEWKEEDDYDGDDDDNHMWTPPDICANEPKLYIMDIAAVISYR